jgi:hypothetical protein
MLKAEGTVVVSRISGQQLLIQTVSLCIGEELAPQGFLQSSRPENRKDPCGAAEYHSNSDSSSQDGHMFPWEVVSRVAPVGNTERIDGSLEWWWWDVQEAARRFWLK